MSPLDYVYSGRESHFQIAQQSHQIPLIVYQKVDELRFGAFYFHKVLLK